MNYSTKNNLNNKNQRLVTADIPEKDTINEEKTIEEETEEPKQDKKVKANKFFINYIGGDMLSKEKAVRQFPFILYLALLAMIYITNTYIAEDVRRDIARTNRMLEDRHVEYVYLKSEITNLTKQSVLVKRLKAKGIKESVEPLKKIIMENEGDK